MSRINLKLNEIENIVSRTINGNNVIFTFTPGSFILVDDYEKSFGEIPIELSLSDADIKFIRESVEKGTIIKDILNKIMRYYGYEKMGMELIISEDIKSKFNKHCSRVLDLFSDINIITWLTDLFRASGVLDKSIVGDSKSLLFKIENNHYGIDIADDTIYDFRRHMEFISKIGNIDPTRGILFASYPVIPYLRKFVMCYGEIFGEGNIVYTSSPKNLITQMKMDILSTKFHGRSAVISRLNLYMDKKIPFFEFVGRYDSEDLFILDTNANGRLTINLIFEKQVVTLGDNSSTVNIVPILHSNMDIKDENGNIVLSRGDIINQPNMLKILKDNHPVVELDEDNIYDLELIGTLYYKLISTDSNYGSNLIEKLLTLHISPDDRLGTTITKINGVIELEIDDERIYYNIYRDQHKSEKDMFKLFIDSGIIFKYISPDESEILRIANTRLDSKTLNQFIEINTLLEKIFM